MTPGLAIFYGGMVGSKNVLAVMMLSFISMATTLGAASGQWWRRNQQPVTGE